jgi:hypothetical protein
MEEDKHFPTGDRCMLCPAVLKRKVRARLTLSGALLVFSIGENGETDPISTGMVPLSVAAT